MQLFVKVKLHKPLTLPLSYHHILQGIIYNALSENKVISDFIHDVGVNYDKRRMSMYCMSIIHGHSKVEGKTITFYDYAMFEVRSIFDDIIYILDKSFKTRGIRFGDQLYNIEYTKLRNLVIKSNEILVNMYSPVTIRQTEKLTGRCVFYNPLDVEFSSLLNDNFHRKYIANTRQDIDSDIEIETVEVSNKDKYVTKYKETLIIAWFGTYKIKGSSEALNFVYNTGLGSRNTQGFGMIKIEDRYY